MVFLQPTTLSPCSTAMLFESATVTKTRLRLVDLDLLPMFHAPTIEEIEQDSELTFLLNFPAATDEEIQGIEAAIAEVNQWKTV